MKSRILKLAGLAVAAIFCTIEANAQVGIGTPTPATSAQLEITSVLGDKGILIPRVELTSKVLFAPLVGDETKESLLVYNEGTTLDNNIINAGNGVTPGFYYWKLTATPHWERIVNQEQLDEVLSNLTGDLTKIKELLEAAYPQNNLGESPTTGAGGGMFFDPSVGANGTLYYIQWNDTEGEYDKIDITSNISALIKEEETKTRIWNKNEGDAADKTLEIKYNYNHELVVADANGDVTGTVQPDVINITDGVLQSIENNLTVQNAIKNLLNAGEAVYFGDHDGDPDTPHVFYTIDGSGNKVAIDISTVVTNAIVGATEPQKEEIKTALGDTYSTSATALTGDTWINGAPIYKGIYASTVTRSTANASAITLPAGVTEVLEIKLLNTAGKVLTQSVTDVDLSGTSLTFKIGTGNMYNVLSTTVDLPLQVIVEFAGAVPPTP